jgi:hypothetical protein
MAATPPPSALRQMRIACKHPHNRILQNYPDMLVEFSQAYEKIVRAGGMRAGGHPQEWINTLSDISPDSRMLGLIYWTLYKQTESRDAVWRLDKRTAMSLALTDPPDDNFTEGLNTYLKAPFPSLYLMIPSGIGLTFMRPDSSGAKTVPATVEGVYITPVPNGDLSLLAVFKCTRGYPNFGYAVYVISEDDYEYNSVKNLRDFYRKAGEPDLALIFIIAINFLYALNAGYLSVSSRDPEQKSRSKRKRAGLKAKARAKASTKAITFVSLNRKAEAAEKDRRSMTKKPRVGRTNYWVRGHWHGYWVKQPGEEPVLDRRVSKAGTVLYLIKKLIPAYVVGDPEQTGSPKYRSNPR